MNELIIRKALPSDMGDVLSMIKELAEFEKALDKVKMTKDQLIEDGFGSSPFFNCIIAFYEGEVCGYAFYYFGYSTWNGKTLYLEDIMIKSGFRRKGIGQKLFDNIVGIAKKENVTRFDWQVLNWNQPAIDFYKKNNASFDDEWLNGRLFSLDLKNY